MTADDEIQFLNGQRALPGPAFIAREQSGMVWGGAGGALEKLVNPDDVGKLVLFDTWTRNCDRHPPDLAVRKPNLNNVFLSNEGMPDGLFQLIAMDHTHCFICGRDLNAQLAHIDVVKDDRLYGLFPDFKPLIAVHLLELTAAVGLLQTLNRALVTQLVDSIPAEWEVVQAGRTALVNLICDRAEYVAANFVANLGSKT